MKSAEASRVDYPWYLALFSQKARSGQWKLVSKVIFPELVLCYLHCSGTCMQGKERESGAHDVDGAFPELLSAMVKAAASSLGVTAQGCSRL